MSEINIIAEFVQNHANTKSPKIISVFGDLMLDTYDQVHVNRLSPEFPIPVIDCKSGDSNCVIRSGGAGNVCSQLKYFKSNTHLFSFINNHAVNVLRNHSFDISTCHQCFCHVPLKRRYYDGDFPLCRMDNELPNYGLYDISEERDALLKKFITFADHKKIDVAILSDYNKGVFTPTIAQNLISTCRERQIITIVDPKKNPLQWQNCTIFKPNLAEAANFLHVETSWILTNWKDAVKQLQELTKSQSVVITNGGKGVFGLDNGEVFEYIPQYPVADVRSVIGAGDAFVAILALAVAYGYTVYKAVEIAYEAAAVYVQKKHNEPIWPHELLARVEPSYANIMSHENLIKYCRENKDKKIVFTNGCFDFGLTKGHIDCLNFAKRQGDILIVGLNGDKSISQLKGKNRPIIPLDERMAVVASLQQVDFVTYFDEPTPLELITALGPQLVVKGGDYQPSEVVGHNIAEVRICPYVPCKTTTEKINSLES